jgi:hypothetical protein
MRSETAAGGDRHQGRAWPPAALYTARWIRRLCNCRSASAPASPHDDSAAEKQAISSLSFMPFVCVVVGSELLYCDQRHGCKAQGHPFLPWPCSVPCADVPQLDGPLAYNNYTRSERISRSTRKPDPPSTIGHPLMYGGGHTN